MGLMLFPLISIEKKSYHVLSALVRILMSMLSLTAIAPSYVIVILGKSIGREKKKKNKTRDV